MSADSRVNHEPAFLLSTIPWRESSLLAEMFTRHYGRVVLIARSARKRQSELRGVLTPFVPLSVSWYGTQELKTLHRAQWIGGWPSPQARALFSALYVNELILKLTAREDPAPLIYDAVHQVMSALCLGGESAALRYFEWDLLHHLGFAPDITQDENGTAIDADAHYYMRPEYAPALLTQINVPTTEKGISICGETLLSLSKKTLHLNTRARQETLRLTRLLLDFRLPEGIHSRRVLQQLRQF
ncbi:DNA repair protein RecO [Stenoxybacter acetivorans]|uniref:DNA repair protein RecO n=1 Tax=Stenoxybacter acetivorans TaxID=422441 RepID=UPI00055AEFCE|nr:DNA repair protein RecO [Stenoxybacter acetivorans]